MKKKFRALKQATAFLIGQRDLHALENRIFNSICLITILVVVYNIPFSFFAGIPDTGIIFCILTLVLGLLFYLVRFRNKLSLAIFISSILSVLLFSVNYFISGGVRGASLLSFTLTFFLILTISPRKWHLVWALVFLTLIPGLLIYEYYNPGSVGTDYFKDVNLFLDLGSTYIITIIAILMGLLYLKNAYYREKQLGEEKTRRLQETNDLKNKLFSILSHDLHAPLSSVESYIQMLGHYPVAGEKRELIEKELMKSVQATQGMLSNILSWSRDQLSNPAPRLALNPVGKVLEPALQLIRIRATQKQISLVTDIPAGAVALTDADMLQLIIRNLAGNAVKFTPPGGTIRISASVTGNHCRIVVEDTGIGMSEEKQQNLFSLHAESTYGTQQEKGIGLGLFLCKEYTHIQHGTISLESSPGRGTRITLLFPSEYTS